jgi:hypothetical protein
MPIAAAALEELKQICPGAQEMAEGQRSYLFLPSLKLPCPPGALDGLLCPQEHTGYATRLFLSAIVPGRGQNWTSHVILSRTWYTPSWRDVGAGQRPAEILAQHMRAYR